jgi:hypothetical protein
LIEALVILFLAAMLGALYVVLARTYLPSRREDTIHGARHAKAAAELYQALDCASTPCCPTPQDLVRARKMDASRAEDSWGTPYRIVCAGDGTIHAVSAGPDRTPGTPDDIRDDSPIRLPPDAVSLALLGFVVTVIAAGVVTAPILRLVRRAVGPGRLLLFEALSGWEMVLFFLYAPTLGSVASALRVGHGWAAVPWSTTVAVTSLVGLLVARLGVGASWKFRKAFRVRDGAAYRAGGGKAGPLRIRSTALWTLEPEDWPAPGATVYAIEITLTDSTSLTNRYADEAHRDRDWRALQIPASYRQSPGPAL